MKLMQPFDPNKFDPSQGAGNLPVGRHPVVITDGVITPTRNNDAGMLVLTLMIIDGPAKGRKGPFRLNLYHQNQQTVEIAHRKLSTICHAIGFLQVLQATEQLFNQPFIVDVSLQSDAEAASKGYTEVTHIYDAQGNEPGQQGQRQTQAAPQAQQPQAAPSFGGNPAGNAPASNANGAPPWANAGGATSAAPAAAHTAWGGSNAAPGASPAPAGAAPWAQGGGAAPWSK